MSSYVAQVDLLAPRVGGDQEVGADGAGVEGLGREHVERAHAVHRDLEHERQGAGGDQPDAEAGERAGPDADRDRGEVLADDAGVAPARLDQRRQLLAVLHPLLRATLGDARPRRRGGRR